MSWLFTARQTFHCIDQNKHNEREPQTTRDSASRILLLLCFLLLLLLFLLLFLLMILAIMSRKLDAIIARPRIRSQNLDRINARQKHAGGGGALDGGQQRTNGNRRGGEEDGAVAAAAVVDALLAAAAAAAAAARTLLCPTGASCPS